MQIHLRWFGVLEALAVVNLTQLFCQRVYAQRLILNLKWARSSEHL